MTLPSDAAAEAEIMAYQLVRLLKISTSLQTRGDGYWLRRLLVNTRNVAGAAKAVREFRAWLAEQQELDPAEDGFGPTEPGAARSEVG